MLFGISMIIETSVSIYFFKMAHIRFASRRRYKTEKRFMTLSTYPVWLAINTYGVITLTRMFDGKYCSGDDLNATIYQLCSVILTIQGFWFIIQLIICLIYNCNRLVYKGGYESSDEEADVAFGCHEGVRR